MCLNWHYYTTVICVAKFTFLFKCCRLFQFFNFVYFIIDSTTEGQVGVDEEEEVVDVQNEADEERLRIQQEREEEEEKRLEEER